MTRAEGSGQYRLHGAMTFVTATRGLKLVEPLMRPQARLTFDLSGVMRADSAGVGLLIEWVRLSRKTGSHLRYVHLPDSLRAMIRVGGVEGMLPIDESL